MNQSMWADPAADEPKQPEQEKARIAYNNV